MPLPSRTARDVLSLLTAATGLALAGRPDARVELLPGSPTTVIISAGDRPAAAFVLPISADEAGQALGNLALAQRDPMLEQLWEQERWSAMILQDAALDAERDMDMCHAM